MKIYQIDCETINKFDLFWKEQEFITKEILKKLLFSGKYYQWLI
jgi:hypothetical protein